MKLKETSSSEIQQHLLQRLEALFSKDGYQIVDLNYAVVKSSAQFSIVLFHPVGVSLDDCAELHKIADVEIERMQAEGYKVSADNAYSLELSSPGLGRNLRSRREFQVFRGQQIRYLIGEEWRSALLLGLDERNDASFELHLELGAPTVDGLTSNSNSEELSPELRIPLEQIVKVKLDS